MTKLSFEHLTLDVPDLNRFSIGDIVKVNLPDWSNTEAIVIGIELTRVHGMRDKFEQSITLLHDVDAISDGFKAEDLTIVKSVARDYALPRPTREYRDEMGDVLWWTPIGDIGQHVGRYLGALHRLKESLAEKVSTMTGQNNFHTFWREIRKCLAKRLHPDIFIYTESLERGRENQTRRMFELESWAKETHIQNIEMRHALWDLGPSCTLGNIDVLEHVANEFDCCPGCDVYFSEGDTGATVCHKSDKGECPNDYAEGLRDIARGFKAKLEFQQPPSSEQMPASSKQVANPNE